MKLLKNDEIIVIKGKDKGKTGKIERVLSKEEKILVPGINQVKRHLKGNVQGQKSEIVVVERPMTIGKVALVCPKCKKQTRVGYRMENDKKVRYCKKCEKTI